MPSTNKKVILVIGATGAQGIAVIDALLAPAENGAPSPYAVRALTRDTRAERARSLAAKGVELVQGSFEDLATVKKALQGAYGAWVNTDGFTVGEKAEIYLGMRMFEIAKQLGTVRHFVWSSLDYSTKKGNYNPDYKVEHYDGKGRVADWMKAQPSDVSDNGMTWSVVTSGPYMEMLDFAMFGPIGRRKDGTVIFATPVGKGHVPMIALKDLGWWARYTFDHRAESSMKDYEIASDRVGWEYLRETYEKVTGKKAIVVYQEVDEWMGNLKGIVDEPVAIGLRGENTDGLTTWRQNFSAFWRQWRDDIITRDYDWLRSVHPGTRSLEKWMRETGYTGKRREDVLKNSQDGLNALELSDKGKQFSRAKL
jgi:uncharacterized protein YbjT (DUF2867 family)